MSEPRVVELRERHVAVVEHRGPVEDIDRTRRPLYRHMIIHELVGGPSIIRFLDEPRDDRVVDALVLTHAGFEGDDVCRIEVLPAGRYAVLDYEGPESGLDEARRKVRTWAAARRERPSGPLLQVHHMDPVEGSVEEQLQLPLS